MRFLPTGAILAAALVAGAAPATEPGLLRAGAAKVDITPTDLAGLDPMGYGALKAVHDPIFARALVVDNGREPIAVVALDAIETGNTLPLRERIHRELGIAVDHILIVASHDHSAPRRGEPTTGALTKFGTPQSDAWTAMLDEKIVGALKQAKATLRPARFAAADGQVDVSINRDFYTPKGWGFGFNPEGPSDKTVRMLKFESLAGEPIAVLFNYGVHPTAALPEHQLTGDLAGAAEGYIEDSLGGGAVALFTQGSGGDQHPRYTAGEPADGAREGGRARVSAFVPMQALGTVLGAEVVRVARGTAAAATSVRLTGAERVVTCPIRSGAEQLRTFQTGGAKPEDVKAVPIRLGLLTIDQVALAAVGGEVVTNIARRLHEASPLKDTLLVTLANDRTGYYVDDATYDSNTFEVQATPAARGCAEQGIVDGLADMIRQSQR